MLKLSSSGMKKGMSILVAAFFVVSLTAVAASARGGGGRGGGPAATPPPAAAGPRSRAPRNAGAGAQARSMGGLRVRLGDATQRRRVG